jgi:hypothetical protein
MIVIPFHVRGLDAIVRMIRRYTYPKGEAISDRTYNGTSVVSTVTEFASQSLAPPLPSSNYFPLKKSE